MYISYLEIYNEAGYDLLDPSQDTKALEELPYVSCGALQRAPCSLLLVGTWWGGGVATGRSRGQAAGSMSECVDAGTSVGPGRRVTLMEDDVGNVHLKNLSLHLAANEEDALNLLFVVREGGGIASRPRALCWCQVGEVRVGRQGTGAPLVCARPHGDVVLTLRTPRGTPTAPSLPRP